MSLTALRIGESFDEKQNRPLGQVLYEAMNPYGGDWSDVDDEDRWNLQRAAKAVVREAVRQAGNEKAPINRFSWNGYERKPL